MGKVIQDTKKVMIRVFKAHDFNLVDVFSIMVMEYLDVKFDLPSEEYSPYAKPSNIIQYIDNASDHCDRLSAFNIALTL